MLIESDDMDDNDDNDDDDDESIEEERVDDENEIFLRLKGSAITLFVKREEKTNN